MEKIKSLFGKPLGVEVLTMDEEQQNKVIELCQEVVKLQATVNTQGDEIKFLRQLLLAKQEK